MASFNKEIIKKQNATELVEAYRNACAMIKEAYMLLEQAEKLLVNAFGVFNVKASFSVVDRYLHWYDANGQEYCRQILEKIRKGAWYQIIEILEIKKVMSLQRIDELDKKLDEGQLPEIIRIVLF